MIDQETLAKIEATLQDAGLGYATMNGQTYYAHVRALLEDRAELLGMVRLLEEAAMVREGAR